jgi:hypothetical protein
MKRLLLKINLLKLKVKLFAEINRLSEEEVIRCKDTLDWILNNKRA